MDEKELLIEQIKATIESHTAQMIYLQTKILFGGDKSQIAFNTLQLCAETIDECRIEILKIK